MLDQTIGDTLALVNVVREAFGQAALTELPDARPGDTQDCLYFRALKDVGCTGVGGSSMTFASDRTARTVAALWGVEARGNSIDSPKNIRSIIGTFDNKGISHYNV